MFPKFIVVVLIVSVSCLVLIARPAHASPCGMTYLGGYLDDRSSGVVARDGYAFLAARDNGFRVLNVSDPSDMHLVAELPSAGRLLDIVVEDDLAYFASDNDGLTIIDISDPLNPSVVSRTPTGGVAIALVIRDGYAFVSNFSGSVSLSILDISNPISPVSVSGFTGLGASSQRRGVAISDDGNTAYVCDSNVGVAVIDVTDRTTPSIIGQANSFGTASSVNYADGLIYVSFSESISENYFRIFDVSDPTNPIGRGRSDQYGPNRNALDFVIEDDLLYGIHGDQHILKVYDISNPDEPTFVVNRQIETNVPVGVRRNTDLTIENGIAYMVTDAGVHAFRVSGIKRFRSRSSVLLDAFPQGRFPDGQIALRHGNEQARVFWYSETSPAPPEGAYVMETIDISDPSGIRRLGTTLLPGISSPVNTSGSTVYAFSSSPTPQMTYELLAIDTVNPGSYKILASVDTGVEFGPNSEILSIHLDNQNLYLFVNTYGTGGQVVRSVLCVDTSDPNTPTITKRFTEERELFNWRDWDYYGIDGNDLVFGLSVLADNIARNVVCRIQLDGPLHNPVQILADLESDAASGALRGYGVLTDERRVLQADAQGPVISPVPLVPLGLSAELAPKYDAENVLAFEPSFNPEEGQTPVAFTNGHAHMLSGAYVYTFAREEPGRLPLALSTRTSTFGLFEPITLSSYSGNLLVLSWEPRVFELSAIDATPCRTCRADFNDSGTTNFGDVTAFLTLYGLNDPLADLDNSGSLNFGDVTEFLTLYAQGCP